MDYTDILILGAGPTGLGAAWRAQEIGRDWLIAEASTTPGGMASTAVDDHGFRWDIGGHVIASHFPYFDEVVRELITDWSYPQRSAWVQLDGNPAMIPAPIQQNLHAMRIAAEDITLIEDVDPSNLEEYHQANFGTLLNDRFFRPYNTKMWATRPRDMDHSWTSLRGGSAMANVPPLRTGNLSKVQDRSFIAYPTKGTGVIWDELYARLNPTKKLLGLMAMSVDVDAHVVTFENGYQVTYKELISTMPLNELLSMTADPLHSMMRRELKHSSIVIFGLGFAGVPPRVLAGKSYVLNADPNVPWHRLTMLSNYSAAMAPKGCWSALLEISHGEAKQLPSDYLDQCVESLAAMGAPRYHESRFLKRLKLGYPVPTIGLNDTLGDLQADLLENDIRARGRFGGWRYQSSNQDYAFMQGVQAVDGGEEGAYWHPEDARNSNQLTEARS